MTYFPGPISTIVSGSVFAQFLFAKGTLLDDNLLYTRLDQSKSK